MKKEGLEGLIVLLIFVFCP